MADEKRGLLFRTFGRAPAAPPARIEPRLPVERPTPIPKVARPQARAFKAAKAGRLAGGFGLLATSGRAEVRQDLRGLIQHARHGAQNIDYLRAFEMMVRRHVIGKSGIVLQMAALNPDRTPDRPANRHIQDAWFKWGKRGNCTTCGRLSWWQVENIAATMIAREGNFLLRIWKGWDFGPFGFQIQPLSVDLLDLSLVQSLDDGAYIDGGIEFDILGRVRAFHMFEGHPAETHTRGRNQRVRIPADQIVHVIRQTETGQALGVPSSHTALRRFNMLAQYEEAALQAAHFGAAAMAFLKPPEDDAPGSGGEDGEEIPVEIEAGAIATLPPGYDLASFVPNYPDGEMPSFNKAMIRGGASGLGVSYSGISGDMEGASYSSLLDGRGEERDEWRMFQRDLFEGLHAEVFKQWLPMAMLSGEVDLPLASLAKYQAAQWRPRGWRAVNPKDDAASNEQNLANMLVAPSDILAERGEDFEEVIDRIAGDMALIRAAALGVTPSAFQPKAGAPAAPSPQRPPGVEPGEPFLPEPVAPGDPATET